MTTKLFQNRVKDLRTQIVQSSRDVLINTEHFPSILSILCASWAEKRRAVFAPNLQPKTVHELASARDLLVLGSPDDNDLWEIDFDLLCEPEGDIVIAEFHTSGSEGNPLCVEKNASQLFDEGRLLSDLFNIGPEKTLMSGVPVRHLYGFLFSVMIPKTSGCRFVVEKPLSNGAIARIYRAFSVDIFVSSPAQLRSFVSFQNPPKIPIVFSSGAPLHEQTRLKLETNKTSVIEIFGSTETGGIASRCEKTPWWTPLRGVQVKQCANGKLSVCSPFLEIPGVFYNTEDRVEVLDGKFRHLGRADDIVKIGGKRVSKRALSNAILAHPQVEDVAIGTIDEGTITLHAFVVMHGKASTLREYLNLKMDPTIVPKLHLVDHLPRGGLGKLSRMDLNEMIQGTKRSLEIIGTVVSESQATVQVFVPENCLYFDGHFDDFSILPGLAQLTLVERQISEIWDLSLPIRAKRLKFKAPVYPDSYLEVSLTRDRYQVSFVIHCRDIPCTSGSFEYADEGPS